MLTAVVLEATFDPGVRTATGHRRFLIGLDLGQAQDPSAYVVMRDEAIPEWHTSIAQRLGERQRTVVAADRIRDTSYVEVARVAGALMASPAIAGRCHLEGGDDEGHADMVFATALAWWLSDSRLTLSQLSHGKLEGWF